MFTVMDHTAPDKRLSYLVWLRSISLDSYPVSWTSPFMWILHIMGYLTVSCNWSPWCNKTRRGQVNCGGFICDMITITAENLHCFVSSAQYPVDMGFSPELCPALAPRRRNPSALCFVCICPSPSQSRAATWARAKRRDLPWRPRWATQTYHPTMSLFQVQQTPSPSLRPLQLQFLPLSQVSAHTFQLP